MCSSMHLTLTHTSWVTNVFLVYTNTHFHAGQLDCLGLTFFSVSDQVVISLTFFI